MTDITRDSEFLGDFRNGFDFVRDKQTEEWKLRKRVVELNQGELQRQGRQGLQEQGRQERRLL